MSIGRRFILFWYRLLILFVLWVVPNSGVANLLRLFEDFRQFDRVQLLDKKLGAVSTNQVVAVELHSEGMKNKKEWYRAVAMEDVILGEQSEVTLRLVDYGTLITAPLSQLALLPSKLLRYPPLVIIPDNKDSL